MAFAICYLDDDGDGYGDPDQQRGCGNPNAVANPDDCNDADPDINPGATEICNNDIDEDCNDYVDDIKVDCNGNGDYLTIQEGIDAADTTGCDTVLVYPCTYYENIDFNGLDNLTVIAASSNAPNDTIINGDIFNNQILDGSVVTIASGEIGGLLVGFTIENGGGTEISPSVFYGGGIYIYGSSAEIKNCVIIDNDLSANIGSGGGVYVGGASDVVISDCNIGISGSPNTADYGGGIYLQAAGSLEIIDTYVSYNTTTSGSQNTGGGIWSQGYLTITDSHITHNVSNAATRGGGGIYSTGKVIITGTDISYNDAASFKAGGIYLHSYPEEPSEITDCTITNNESNNFPGGIYAHAKVDITGCTITGNRFCGIFLESAISTIEGCTIDNNYREDPYESGAGIHCTNTTLSLENCIISNHSYGSGGGISIKTSSTVDIINCTIAYNKANYGGGIYTYLNSETHVMNSIFYDNTAIVSGDEIFIADYPSSSVDVTYSDVDMHDIGGPPGDPPVVWPGEGNIYAYPLFETGDCNNYDLGLNSLCIDAGTSTGAPSDDICGNTRDSYPDMGAVEDVD